MALNYKKREKDNFRNYYDIIEKIGMRRPFIKIYKVKSKENNEKRAIKVFEKEEIRSMLEEYEHAKGSTEKVIKPYIDKILKYIENMKKIEREAECSNTVVKFYEYFNTEDEFAIVMELCDGNLINNQKERFNGYNIEKIKEILIQLNNTFKIMNKYMIYKKNIKFENFLIKYDNHDKNNFLIKLVDYYHLKEYESTPIGNIHYQLLDAPEILQDKVIDEKTDLWNLGEIIYYLYFKKYPHTDTTIFEFLQKIKESEKSGETILKKTGNSDFDDLIKK